MFSCVLKSKTFAQSIFFPSIYFCSLSSYSLLPLSSTSDQIYRPSLSEHFVPVGMNVIIILNMDNSINHLQVELHVHWTCQLKQRFLLRSARVCGLTRPIQVRNEFEPVSHSANSKLGHPSGNLFWICWCV